MSEDTAKDGAETVSPAGDQRGSHSPHVGGPNRPRGRGRPPGGRDNWAQFAKEARWRVSAQFTPADRRASAAAHRIKVAGSGLCEVCGWAPPEKTMLHAHHVVPRSRGGSDEPSNILVVCPNHHALAHYVSPRGHRTGYYGPRTRERLVELVRLAETSPADFERSKAELQAEYVRAELQRVGLPR